MVWDFAKLKKKKKNERHVLWLNAKNLAAAGDEDAKNLVTLIETSGLDYLAHKEASVALDHPICITIRRIAFSAEGQAAAVAAQNSGLPPLAGIDPLLKAALGKDYSKNNESTVQAGYLVTDLMEMLGFEKIGTSAPLPFNCTAKTGALFRKGRDNAE